MLARSQREQVEGAQERLAGFMQCGRPRPGRCAVGQPLRGLYFILLHVNSIANKGPK